jgi:predicted transcriptional regulator
VLSTSDVFVGQTVADAMILTPKIFDIEATVHDVKTQFEDDHVHAVLVVHGGVLLTVVERPDLDHAVSDDEPALSLGRLAGRVVAGDHLLEAVHRAVTQSGTRRLAVIDEDGRLVGLLCLKEHGLGFCSDADLRARADERKSVGTSAATVESVAQSRAASGSYEGK